MKRLFFVLFLGLMLLNSYGAELTVPNNVTVEIDPKDEEIKSLVWNRFINKNFVILSIDEKQGAWLSKNIDKINIWCTSRWGLPQVEFSQECRIFCVPNKSLLKKLFGLEESKVEVRKKDDKIVISVLWLVLEDSIPSTVAPFLTRASLAELAEQEEITIPWWFVRSAEILNSPIDRIKENLSLLEQNKKSIDLKSMLSMQFKDYQILSQEDKTLFDQNCMVLCLMLRKELGELKLHSLLRLQEKNDIETVINFVYGYRNIQEFENKFLLFYEDLSKALSLEKVPDHYLQITNKGNNL